jgi:ABC-type transport system substrate-binding protein
VEVVKTVIVTEVVQGETVEKIITATPAAPVEVAAEGPLEVGIGKLVACQPLPELPSAVSAIASAAPIVSDVPKPQAPSYFKPRVDLQQGGKVYKVGVFEDVTSTNFFAANGPDNTVYNSYMLPARLTLYYLTDKYFTFVPFTAKDLPTPLTQEGDFWVVEIPLREDVKWSDGTAFTAKDVAFSANAVLRMHLISGNFSSWYDGNYLDHMEATSDYVVKIFYHTKPGLARHEWGTLQAPIIQEAYWAPIIDEAAKPIDALAADATDEQKAAADQEAADILFAHVPEGEPTGGGFTLAKWEKGAFLEVAKNAQYLDAGLEIKQWANGAYEDSEGLKIGTPPEGEVKWETGYTIGPNVDSVV